LRDRQAKHLTRRAYRALGGVGGALAQHAESVLAEMSEDGRRIVRELFRHLVTAEGTRAVLSRDELLQVGGGEAAGPVIEALIHARLLTASEGASGVTIEVVHETLLASWPRLVSWRAKDAENARLRDQLRGAARQWDERGRPRGLLWRAEALAEYRLWRRRYPGSLTLTEEAFGAASVADAERGRRIRRGLLVATGIAMTAAIVVFAQLRSAAEDARARAQTQLIDTYREQASRALDTGDAFAALVYLDGAAGLGADSPDQHFMIARSLDEIAPQIVTLAGAEGLPRAAFAADDSLVTIGLDHSLRRWSPDGKLLWNVTTGSGEPFVAVDPLGRWIAAGGQRSISLRNFDGTAARELTDEPAQLSGLAFTPDGKFLVSSAFDGAARIWSLPSGESHELATKGYRAIAAFGANRFAAASSNGVGRAGVLMTWSADGGEPRTTSLGDVNVLSIAMTSDGAIVAVAIDDGSIQLWNAETMQRTAVLRGHDGAIMTLAMRSDGLLASGSFDATIKVWDTKTASLVHTLSGHHAQITRVRFDARGRLVSTDAGGLAKIWDPEKGACLRTLQHGGLLDLAVNNQGTRIATTSELGTTTIWNVDASRGLDELPGGQDTTQSKPWLASDGSRLARATAQGVELWDVPRRHLITRLGGPGSVLATDGDRVYVADGQTVQSVSISDGTVLAEMQAPFGVRAMCVEPGQRRVVVADTDVPRIAVLPAAATRALPERPDSLACVAGEVATFGKRASFFALPALRPIATEAVAENSGVAQALPGLGILGQPTRREVAVWREGQRIATFTYATNVFAVASTAWTFIAGELNGSIVERDVVTGATKELRGHQAAIIALATSNGLMASVSIDGALVVWGPTRRAMYRTRVSPDTYWLGFAGDEIVATDGVRVEVIRADLSPLDAAQLAGEVACRVPERLREQIGGPPRTQPCRR
jgi:WD40 repeat protein